MSPSGSLWIKETPLSAAYKTWLQEMVESPLLYITAQRRDSTVTCPRPQSNFMTVEGSTWVFLPLNHFTLLNLQKQNKRRPYVLKGRSGLLLG